MLKVFGVSDEELSDKEFNVISTIERSIFYFLSSYLIGVKNNY